MVGVKVKIFCNALVYARHILEDTALTSQGKKRASLSLTCRAISYFLVAIVDGNVAVAESSEQVTQIRPIELKGERQTN